MKKRKLWTDIFTGVLMVAIVFVLLSYLDVLPGESNTVEGSLSYIVLTYISMPLALISVAMIDLVFPILDNRALFARTDFKIKVGVKVALFLVAVIFGILFFLGGAFSSINDFVGVAIFCVLYFAQFCINLDPKAPRQPEADEAEEPEEERYAHYDEEPDDDEDEDEDDEDDGYDGDDGNAV